MSAGKLLVQRLDGSGPATEVSTTLQLAGIDLTAGALLLNDGWRAEVVRVDELNGSSSVAATFEVQGLPTHAAKAAAAAGAEDTASACQGVSVGACDGRVAMALHADCVYRTAEGRVEVCSWAGRMVYGFCRHRLSRRPCFEQVLGVCFLADLLKADDAAAG